MGDKRSVDDVPVEFVDLSDIESIHSFINGLVREARVMEDKWRRHNRIADMAFWLVDSKGMDLKGKTEEEIVSLALKSGYSE